MIFLTRSTFQSSSHVPFFTYFFSSNNKVDKVYLKKLAAGNEPLGHEPVRVPEVHKDDPVNTQPVSRLPSSETLAEIVEAKGLAVPAQVYNLDVDFTVSPPSSSLPTLVSESHKELGELSKPYPWTGFEDDELPEKTNGKLLRNLRHQVLTLYRRLFGIVFLTNLGIIIATAVRGGFDSEFLGKIAIANLLIAVLMRQDYIINTFFCVFSSVPPSWPLFVRKNCGKVYHLGGRECTSFFG
jgi:hypothetical protein